MRTCGCVRRKKVEKDLKLILLPGLHGTAELFDSLTKELSLPVQIIELPPEGDQSVEELAVAVVERLPREQIIILAESFSGCLIPRIIELSPENIIGVIFVASFIRPPNVFYVWLGSFIPTFFFNSAFLLTVVLRFLFLNGNHDKVLLQKCVQTVNRVPVGTIKLRLRTLAKLNPLRKEYSIPAVYIQAGNDRAIKAKNFHKIAELFPATIIKIPGPHFLLQAKPEASAVAILKAVKLIQENVLTR